MYFESSDEEDYIGDVMYLDGMSLEKRVKAPTLGDFIKPPVATTEDDDLWTFPRTPILLSDAMNDGVDKSCLDEETSHALLDELRIAAWNGNLVFVSKYVPELIDINVKFKNNWTLLLSAAFGAQDEILEYLVNLPKCDVKQCYKSSNLLMAVINAEISNLEFPSDNQVECRINKCLTILIQAGLDVNASDSFGTTPLMFAAMNNQLLVMQHLISSGAQVNLQDLYGDTALHVACRKGYSHAVSLLQQNGADLKIKNKSYETPVQCATSNDHKNVAQMLSSSCEEQANTR